MPRPTTRAKKKAVYPPIDPHAYYPLRTFVQHAGIGEQTIAAAKRAGLPVPADQVGRVKFLAGHKGIQWLQELAAAGVRTYRSETFKQD